jgi:hypothetical protein
MALPTTLPAAIVETILTHLAGLFLAGAAGDPDAARHAAAQMLGSYHPETEDELRLAANVVGFSFHALEALGQAAAPDLPITRILRLRGSAVSLSRQSQNAERRLVQLQTARRKALPAAAETRAEPVQSEPGTEAATASATGKTRDLTWTQAYEQRQRETRIAASLKRAEARVTAQSNHTAPAYPATQAAIPTQQSPAVFQAG